MALTFYNPNQGNPFFQALSQAKMLTSDEIREKALKENMRQTQPYLNDLAVEFNQDAKNVSLMRNDENKFVFGGTKGKQGDLLTEWKSYKELMGEGAIFNDFKSLYDTGTAQVDSSKVASINKYVTDESLRGVSNKRIIKQFQSPEINAFISRLQKNNPELYSKLLLPTTITGKIGLGEKLGQFIEDHPLMATGGALAGAGGLLLGGKKLMSKAAVKGAKDIVKTASKIGKDSIPPSGPSIGKTGQQLSLFGNTKTPKAPIKQSGKLLRTAKTLGRGAAGAIAGSGIGYGVGSLVGGEKGGKIGEVAGGTTGIYALPKMWDVVSKKVSEKGMPWAMKRIAKKGGPSLLARVLAKAGLAGFSGALTGGLSTALMTGFVAKDLYDIANILAEEK